MKIALDIDGTISARPDFYLFLALSVLAQGGDVVIISARHEGDRDITVRQLEAWGFGDFTHDEALYLYPEPYDWQDPDVLEGHLKRHGSWKARKCLELGVEAIIDDDPHVLIAAREAGIYSLSAGFVAP